MLASQGNWSEVIPHNTVHSKHISCLADEAIWLVNPHLLMSSQMSYQLTQILKQYALAASCVGYLAPTGARIDQKTDQCNRGMLLLIAIKSALSGPLSLSVILWVSLNKPLLGKDAAKWQSINSLLLSSA